MKNRVYYAGFPGLTNDDFDPLWVFATKKERDKWVSNDPGFRMALRASSTFVRRINRHISPNLKFFSPMAKSAYYGA